MSDKKVDLRKIRMLNDGVLAKPWTKTTEIGGIIIPTSAAEDKSKSEVIAVGPGWRNEDGSRKKMHVKPGDIIYHTQFAGSEVSIEGEKHLVMKQPDIYGVFHGKFRPIDISPLGDRIFLEWEDGQELIKGTKIARAVVGQERHYTGIVIGCGPKVKDVVVGDRVFFDQFCGVERIDFDGKRYAWIYEHDIYCTIPKRQEMEVLSQ